MYHKQVFLALAFNLLAGLPRSAIAYPAAPSIPLRLILVLLHIL